MEKIMRNKVKESKIPFLLLFIVSMIEIALKFLNFSANFTNITSALIGIVCFVYYLVYGNNFLKIRAVLIGLGYSILMVISILYNENAGFEDLMWIPTFLGPALLLYEYGLPQKMGMLIFYLSSLIIILRIFVGSGSEIDDMQMGGSSTNIVSVMLIYALCLYYFSILRSNTKAVLPYLPILIIAFLSLFVANRGGVLVTLIFFFLMLCYNFKVNITKNIIVILIMLVLCVLFIDKLDLYTQNMEQKLDRNGTESPRTLIWKEYIDACKNNVGSFVFGVPCGEYHYLNYFNKNTHNAFFMLHAKFGLVGFLIMIMFIMKSGAVLIKKKLYPILFCLLLIMMRSFFDWTAFPGIFDILFLYFVFVAFDKYKHVRYRI